MRPRLSPKRAAIVLVTAAAGLFLMPSLLSPLFAARSDPAYPRLSENTAASTRLEVRKLLHGQVDGLFAVPSTGQVIAAAGGTLWKFSADGLLLDTLDAPADMHVSGIAFGPEGYVDWVFTGERERRAYAPAVDGGGLSRKELEAELGRAQVVAFGRDDAHAWAWLWTQGRAWKLRIDPYREQVDTWCRQRSHSDEALGWHATCLEDYAPQAAALVEVEPESFSRGYGDLPPRLRVAGFDRRKYHLEEGVSGQLLHATVGTVLKGMGVPGGGPGRYWFGDAHVQLDVGGDTLKFKAFVPRVDGDYEFLRNMRWWEPSQVLPGASPWFSVHMRDYMEYPGERELLEYYRDDIGLYVVRPRGTGEAAPAQRQVPAWQPRFEGEPTRYRPVTAAVELADGSRVRRWLRPPPPHPAVDTVPKVVVEPVQPDLHALPRSMTVTWGAAHDRRNAPTCGWCWTMRRCANGCPRPPVAPANWCCACPTCMRRPRGCRCCCANPGSSSRYRARAWKCCAGPRSVPTVPVRPAGSRSCAPTLPPPAPATTPRSTSSCARPPRWPRSRTAWTVSPRPCWPPMPSWSTPSTWPAGPMRPRTWSGTTSRRCIRASRRTRIPAWPTTPG